MVHVGIDVHQSSSVFEIFDPEAPLGGRSRSLKRPTTAAAFEEVLRPLAGRCQVAFEVCPQVQWLAAVVRPWAVKVQVANASRIPWLFRDGRKNDRLDAAKLAKLSFLGELPTVHLPSPEISGWRALIQYRRRIVQSQTRLKNQIRSILRTFVRPCPQRSCWTKAGRLWLASQSFDAARDVMMKCLLKDLDAGAQRLREIEKQLDAIAATQPAVALWRSIPGVGARTAEAIVAYTDDLARFGSRKQFTSYFGMTPTEDSSGQVVRRGRISKRGPSVVRWVLTEAAQQAIRRCPALRAYAERVAKGRKERWKKAIVATGRKLLSIGYGMLRRGETFDVRRVSGARNSPAAA